MRYLTNKPLILIFLLALFLRLYKLGTFPLGFHADEVRVAWNATSIMETGKDDRNNFLPLYYNTFGDYRPTGIFYITAPSIAIFGNNEFATRLPSAFLGALTVFPLFGFTYYLTRNKNYGLLAAFFLSITSWHIVPSRATSEVVISLFLFLISLCLYERAKRAKDRRLLYLSVFVTTLSYFFYHSIRLLAPFYFLTLLLVDYTELKKIQLIKPVLICLVGLVILTTLFTLTVGGRGRLSQVSLLKDKNVQTQVLGTQTKQGGLISKLFENAPQVYLQNSIQEYTTYFSPQFLIGETPLPARYKIPGIGLISIPLFLLLLAGLIGVIQKKYTSTPLILLLLSPLPAIITREDSPNLHRAFYMLPFVIILIAFGAHYIYKNKKLVTPLFTLWIFFAVINMLIRYTSVGAIQMEQYRSPGAKVVAVYLNEVKSQYDDIYVTNDPDSLYPWFAFFTKQPVRDFNAEAAKRIDGEWKYGNIHWTQNKCPTGQAFDDAIKMKKKILVVNNGECSDSGLEISHPGSYIVKKINYYPEKTAYVIWEYDRR